MRFVERCVPGGGWHGGALGRFGKRVSIISNEQQMDSKSREAELTSPVTPYAQSAVAYVDICVCIYVTRLRLVARFPRFLCALPSFPAPPLTYCKMAGPKCVVSQSRSKKSSNKSNNLNTYTQNHPRTYTNQI